MKLSTFAKDNYLRIFEVDKHKLKVVGHHKSSNYILCESEHGKTLTELGERAVKFINNYKPGRNAKFKWIRHSEIGLNSKWQETKNTLPKHKAENTLTEEELKALLEVLWRNDT